MDNSFTTENEIKTSSYAESIWSKAASIIKREISPMSFNTWFAPIKVLELTGSTLKIQLPDLFFWEWIEQHYSSLLHNALKKTIGHDVKVDYIIVKETDTLPVPEPVLEKNPLPKVVVTNSGEVDSTLNPKYTFDNFIKGEGNQLAHAAAGAISKNPGGTSFNPLFLYGGVGLGKTHLIQAIGNEIKKIDPTKRVKYLSTDRFTVEFVEAIQANKVNEFSNYYRSMDVLIIDDIQFLIAKEKTQDLFFHIFNSLHQARKQIILSSDKAPKDLKGMDERLISRFNWGLTADIQPPDFETRLAILNKKVSDFGMDVGHDIIEYIAIHVTSNIRELEGCLIKLLANASFGSKQINYDLVRNTVREISTINRVTISIELITKLTSAYFKIDENKMRDKTRKKEIVFARQVSMYFSKTMTNYSLKTIGLHFGGRDHSTVIHACQTIEEMAAADKNIRSIIEDIRSKISSACS